MNTIRLTLVTCCLTVFACGLFAADPVGEIISVEGTAEAVHQDGKKDTLDLKSPVFLNDKIVTGAGSKLQIMFQDDSILSQGENSEMVIDEYSFNPTKKEENGCVMSFVKGAFRSITGKITDLNPDRFKVKTRMATIGIRGCDLGFKLQEKMEDIYIVRIPPLKSIRINAIVGGSTGGDTMDVTKQGFVVSIFAGGRMKKRIMTAAEVKGLISESTPKTKKQQARDAGGAEGDGEGQQPGEDGQQGDQGDEGAQGPQMAKAAGAPGSGDGNDPGGDWGTDLGDGVNDGPLGDDPASGDGFVPQNDGTGDNITDDTILDDTVVDDPVNPEPQPPPPDPDPQPQPQPQPDPDPDPQPTGIAGGAAGAIYNTDEGYYSLERIFKYDKLDGGFGEGSFNGTLFGSVMNRDGVVLDAARSDLNDVPVTPYGGATYEGYTEVALDGATILDENGNQVKASPTKFVAYDNLGQFFRYIDLSNPEMTLAFGGYGAGTYGAVLPVDQVLKYDIKGLELEKDYFYGSVPGIKNGNVYINTRTGAYMLEDASDDLMSFGYLDELQFYGQEAQGVGSLQEDGIFAGFRDRNTAAAYAETGVLDYRGYGVGMIYKSLAPEADMSLGLYRSADESSDDPASAETRVFTAIDKGGYRNNLQAGVYVFADPAAPSADDPSLANPTESYYVKDDNASGIWRDEQGMMTSELQTQGGGMDWTWGMWDGDLESTAVSQDSSFKGFFVTGDTLSSAEYQSLLNGPTAYTLNTPAATPGRAGAYVLDGYQTAYLDGNCYLNVSVPGNGASPSWTGLFNMQQNLGARVDTLEFEVSSGYIGPNGHLHGNVSSYNLVLDGIAHGQSTIASEGITGNLVGSGSGETPVTGAIGQFGFTHSTGPRVGGVFGTDLQSGAAKASTDIHYAPAGE